MSQSRSPASLSGGVSCRGGAAGPAGRCLRNARRGVRGHCWTRSVLTRAALLNRK